MSFDIISNPSERGQLWAHEDKTANIGRRGLIKGIIIGGALFVLAGLITMLVMGILGAKGVVPMSSGGAYALTFLGAIPLLVALGLLKVMCR